MIQLLFEIRYDADLIVIKKRLLIRLHIANNEDVQDELELRTCKAVPPV